MNRELYRHARRVADDAPINVPEQESFMRVAGIILDTIVCAMLAAIVVLLSWMFKDRNNK